MLTQVFRPVHIHFLKVLHKDVPNTRVKDYPQTFLLFMIKLAINMQISAAKANFQFLLNSFHSQDSSLLQYTIIMEFIPDEFYYFTDRKNSENRQHVKAL